MNSNEEIQRNQTITFLPSFQGLEVFKRNNEIIFLQDKKEIYIPFLMVDAFIAAINKAKGVKNEG